MNAQASSVDQERAATKNLPREVLDSFHGSIEPVKTPISYRLGALLVAIVMIILPLIYIAIIGLVGYAVYYHAVNHTEMLKAARGRGAAMVFLAYLAPMVIGGILILFMFKPLLSRPARREKRESLSREKEPLLFAFVDRLCEAVRAPKPRRIDVDEEVNASASFRRGMFSMLGSDLVLTIGLPLVAGLNLRQFAGVLAHEFGHFSQGAGMRLTYIIRTISHWFTRVVYERDQWDEQLVEWSQSTDLRIGWVLYLARLFVWMTRKILWVLMMIGHVVSSLMLRQMEFDADRHEARLAGSEVFASTSKQILLLSVAGQGAQSDLGDFYREGRLCDNLPKLILHNRQQFTPDLLQKLEQVTKESKTGWLDTHPCDSDRIASAMRENAPGIFQLEIPAADLFADFDGTCQRVTWEYYRDIFGDRLNRQEIHPVEQLLARQELQQQAYKSLDRYLQRTFRSDRPLRLPLLEFGPPEDPRDVLQNVRDAREKVVAAAAKYVQDYSGYEKAQQAGRERLNATLAQFEQWSGKRLIDTLQLLYVKKIAERVESAEQRRQEVKRLLAVLHPLNEKVAAVEQLEFGNVHMAHLFEKLTQDQSNETVIQSLRDQMRHSSELIGRLRSSLMTCKYPYDHARAGISIGEFALAELPDEENPGAIYEAAGSLIQSTVMLRARVIGHLCQIAEQVDRVLGFDPLADPGEPAGEDEPEA